MTFAASGLVAGWDDSAGSLLDFAEAQGLSPSYGCRVGSCHACATTLLAGEVAYGLDVPARLPEGFVLLCSAISLTDLALDL